MKKAAVLFADGFEEIEALTVVDIMRRANIKCDMISIRNLEVTGAHGVKVISDKLIDEGVDDYDLIVLPGGMPGATYLKKDNRVINAIKKFHKEGKFVAAICAAPIVLDRAEIIEEKDITSYPGFEDELRGCKYREEKVVVDGNIITSRGPATAMEFAYKLVEILCKESADDLKKGMLYND